MRIVGKCRVTAARACSNAEERGAAGRRVSVWVRRRRRRRPWVIVATAFPTPPRTSPAALRDTKDRSSLGSNQSLGPGDNHYTTGPRAIVSGAIVRGGGGGTSVVRTEDPTSDQSPCLKAGLRALRTCRLPTYPNHVCQHPVLYFKQWPEDSFHRHGVRPHLEHGVVAYRSVDAGWVRRAGERPLN